MNRHILILSQQIDTGAWRPSEKGDSLYTVYQGKPYRCIVTKVEAVDPYGFASRHNRSAADWDDLDMDEGDENFYVTVEEMPGEEYHRIIQHFSGDAPEQDFVLNGVDLSKLEHHHYNGQHNFGKLFFTKSVVIDDSLACLKSIERLKDDESNG